MAQSVKTRTPQREKGVFRQEMRRNWVLYAMCVPALALLFFLSYLPLPGIYTAFTRFNSLDGIFGSPFV
jgi:ABC-type polysaccharide transport system permease subunit